jgi:hypothetical protein
MDHPCLVYLFSPNREGQWPQQFLKDYAGFLQADAYAGYDALFAKGTVVEAGCGAHARRKFFEVQKAGPEGALYAVGPPAEPPGRAACGVAAGRVGASAARRHRGGVAGPGRGKNAAPLRLSRWGGVSLLFCLGSRALGRFRLGRGLPRAEPPS